MKSSLYFGEWVIVENLQPLAQSSIDPSLLCDVFLKFQRHHDVVVGLCWSRSFNVAFIQIQLCVTKR